VLDIAYNEHLNGFLEITKIAEELPMAKHPKLQTARAFSIRSEVFTLSALKPGVRRSQV